MENKGIVYMCSLDSKPKDVSWDDYIKYMASLPEGFLPPWVKRLDLRPPEKLYRYSHGQCDPIYGVYNKYTDSFMTAAEFRRYNSFIKQNDININNI